jgi:alanine dehydrogenase
VAPAKVVVIGGGVVGENAIHMALGMGAEVTVLDRSIEVLNRLSGRFGAALKPSIPPALRWNSMCSAPIWWWVAY